MPHLLVLAYADEHRAAEVSATIQRLQTGALLDVQNVVCLVRRTDWSLVLHHSHELSEPGGCPCHFWRAFIASLVLAPGLASSRPRLDRYGVGPLFARDLQAVLPPGSSAVFMIIPRRLLTRISAELDCLKGTMLTSPIRPVRQAVVELQDAVL